VFLTRAGSPCRFDQVQGGARLIRKFAYAILFRFQYSGRNFSLLYCDKTPSIDGHNQNIRNHVSHDFL
ncbi:hypothetical protein, partial [Paraburkholderia sediminicola]|uniref:hypothetical protein n=1 Tax=Paraburkholderia sediminicola TaxID=458836 RepID=UPI0038BCB6C6